MLENQTFSFKKMIYCKECVYPKITVLLGIDDDGVCTACKAHKKFLTLSEEKWNERQKKFEEIINKYKNKIIMIVLSQ